MTNESGFYYILANSKKPKAKDFMTKYLDEIMPEIRKTGQYIVNEKTK